ncbi:transposase [Streptomyces sp. NPDC059849]|uniref:transposase n=1 Tax=Streptomyces sp. NPDC059849 TaxID=3346969 RepID=UPI003667E8FB
MRFRRGPRRRRPGKLHADKGYDYHHLRQWLSQRGIRHRIARKGIETSQRLGRHHWTIERTMSWLAGCCRLHRRYECKAEHFLACTSIACILIKAERAGGGLDDIGDVFQFSDGRPRSGRAQNRVLRTASGLARGRAARVRLQGAAAAVVPDGEGRYGRWPLVITTPCCTPCSAVARAASPSS